MFGILSSGLSNAKHCSTKFLRCRKSGHIHSHLIQILTEAGLLPGALMRNAGISFVCRDVPLTVANSQSVFTSRYDAGEAITVPVAHHDGNYFADDATLDRLEGEGRVAFRYAGDVNGSARSIAGILNDAGNVLGMMPHPERMTGPVHGGSDGRRMFEGLAGL